MLDRGGGGGVLLHLKFHNICSIGSTIYTTDAGVFTGSHCNWGLVCACMCMCVSMCAVCACIGVVGEGGVVHHNNWVTSNFSIVFTQSSMS